MRFSFRLIPFFLPLILCQSLGAADWSGTWAGPLNVGAVTFRVALVFQTDASGAVTAGAFNNIDDGIYDEPLAHLSFRAGELQADLAGGETLRLWASGGALTGLYGQAKGSFQKPGVLSPFHLIKNPETLVPRLSPEGRAVTAYAYHPPRVLADGWKTGSWNAARLNGALLGAGLQKVIDGTYPHIHSVQVAYRGRLVLDEYFYGYRPEDLHPLQSETKSIFSALFGVAVDQGRVRPDEKLYDFFPDYRNQPGWSDRKDAITLEDLLTMRSGLACDDWKDAQACSWAMTRSPDWLAFALGGDLAREPGTHFAYCGACLLPLSVILEKRGGLPLAQFAKQSLWDPLGIRKVDWFYAPGGEVPVSFGLCMRPRDLLKIVFLYENQGRWEGRQVLSNAWIAQSSALQVPKSETNGKNDYGYLWWERDMPGPHGPVRVLFAWGVGGQYLLVAPELELVCVITGGNYKSGRLGANSLKLFQENILAALP